MSYDKQNILVTRPLTGRQIEHARVLGLNPIVRPALEFRFPAYWDKVLKTINEYGRSDWIFTSTNGVRALEELMEAGLQVRPELQIFAVGNKTAQALQELGLKAMVPATQNAIHLARLIIEEGSSEAVIYFHGNLSREALAESLRAEGVEVVELEVYETHIREVFLPDEPIDAILFYSPSAVEGFKRGAGFEGELPVLFAIGPTTAAALAEVSDRGIEIADEPATETLLKNVADYFIENHPSDPRKLSGSDGLRVKDNNHE